MKIRPLVVDIRMREITRRIPNPQLSRAVLNFTKLFKNINI